MALICNPNCWILGYDKGGMIRGEFIIPVDGDIWGMCKFIDGKVKEQNNEAFLYSVRHMRYEYDVHFVKVVIKYVYKGWSKKYDNFMLQTRHLASGELGSGESVDGSCSSCRPQQVAQRCWAIPVASEPKQEH